MKNKILRQTDKEVLIITKNANEYIIEQEKDGSSHGNEQVIVKVSGNQAVYFAERILKQIFNIEVEL